MAGLMFLEKITQNSLMFVSPHKSLDPLTCRIDHLAENIRSIEDHLEIATIPTSLRGDKTGDITSLATVNSLVQNCHPLLLSAALKTKFSADHESGEPRSLDSAALVLDKSGLESSVWILRFCLPLSIQMLRTRSTAVNLK
jgi:hypothetical protein